MSDDRPSQPSGEQNDTFTVEYLKSQQFRVAFAEGFLGGLTLDRNVHLELWNSRDPIPNRIVYRLTPGGAEEVTRTVRADQIREVEIGIVMTLETARALRDWLGDVVDEAEEFEDADDALDVKVTEAREGAESETNEDD